MTPLGILAWYSSPDQTLRLSLQAGNTPHRRLLLLPLLRPRLLPQR